MYPDSLYVYLYHGIGRLVEFVHSRMDIMLLLFVVKSNRLHGNSPHLYVHTPLIGDYDIRALETYNRCPLGLEADYLALDIEVCTGCQKIVLH